MSTESSSLPLAPPARIAIHTFTGIAWGGLAISFLFYAFRIYVRIKSFRRLFWDDALVLVAWLMLLANAIIWQRAKIGMYLLYNVQSGRQIPPPANFGDEVGLYLHLLAVAHVMFYSGLWCIKLSFLVFFKRLGQNVARQKAIWWGVTAVVAATYFTSIGIIQWDCSVPSFEEIIKHCQTQEAKDFEKAMIRASCAIDIVSDALIILVPLNMLWRVQISLRRKLGLAGIFSLTVFVMIIAIIRVTTLFGNRDRMDVTWLWAWSFVEQTVAMIIVCLASFRALFSQQSKSLRVPQVNGYTGRTLLRNSKTKPSFGPRPIEKGSTVVNAINTSSSRLNNSSEVTVLPPNSVHVRHDYYVISDVENSQPNSVV